VLCWPSGPIWRPDEREHNLTAAAFSLLETQALARPSGGELAETAPLALFGLKMNTNS
jgi:hypothetical protein